jgi:hypothetical protein
MLVASREIEERFLHFASRQLHFVELKKMRRDTSAGMTVLGGWLG